MESTGNFSMACSSLFNITINWIELAPFLLFFEHNNMTGLTGYLPIYMQLASYKCGCPDMRFSPRRLNISSSEEMEIEIRSSLPTTAPELYFPVFANRKESTQYQRQFLALFNSPGPAIVKIIHSPWEENMEIVNMIRATWPNLCLCLLLGILSGFIVWAIERRKNPDFSGKFPDGALAGIWWSFVTMTTVGYGDKTTRTPCGRVFAVFWMILGTFILSMFTGKITANITSSTMATVDLMDTTLAVPLGMKTFIDDEMNFGARHLVEKTYKEMERMTVNSNDTTIEYAMIHDYKMAQEWLKSAENAKIVKIIDRQFVIGMSITGNHEPVQNILNCLQKEVIDLFQIKLAYDSLKTSSTNNQESGLTSMHILLITCAGVLVVCVLLGFLLVHLRARNKNLTPSDVEQGSSQSTFATELSTIQKF